VFVVLFICAVRRGRNMKAKPKCGICNKYVKTEVVDDKTGEVAFKCKEHGDVTSYVIWEGVKA
jgi:hypothetical protein